MLIHPDNITAVNSKYLRGVIRLYVTRWPKNMLSDEVAALRTLVQLLPVEISGFTAAMRLAAAGIGDDKITYENKSSPILMYSEQGGKPIGKTLNHFITKYIAGKTEAQLAEDGFGLIAVEVTGHSPKVIDAWHMPNFYFYGSLDFNVTDKRQEVNDSESRDSIFLEGNVLQSNDILEQGIRLYNADPSAGRGFNEQLEYIKKGISN